MQRLGLAVILAFSLFAFVCAETTCRSHQRNSQPSGHGMRWNIQCDAEGYYKPLQCTDEEKESKRWCACYNKEEAITQPSRSTRTCVCPLRRDELKNSAECEKPVCLNTGKYNPKQCCATTNKCRCVNTETGEETTAPTSDPNLQCSS